MEQDQEAGRDTIVQVRLPATLQRKELRASLAIALFYLSIGKKPTHIPDENEKRTNTKIRLSSEAKRFFDELLARSEFTSKNQIILHALAFLHERPNLQGCRL
ncbi:MAG: hypothetical protein ACYC4A_10295 [Desulfobulbia bacterium]